MYLEASGSSLKYVLRLSWRFNVDAIALEPSEKLLFLIRMPPAVSGPILILDASSRRVWVGLRNGQAFNWEASDKEATLSLFDLCATVLEAADTQVERLAGIAICRGPGSMLGIRVAAMCIKTWRGMGKLQNVPVFGFSSLDIGIRIAGQKSQTTPFSTVIDARRESWFFLSDTSGSQIELLANEALTELPGEIYRFGQFPSWTNPARSMTQLDYHPELVFDEPASLELLQPTDSVDPFVLRPAEYKKWTPRLNFDEAESTK